MPTLQYADHNWDHDKQQKDLLLKNMATAVHGFNTYMIHCTLIMLFNLQVFPWSQMIWRAMA